MSVTIYHNPKCSKSRKTLELLGEHGITPVIIEYLKFSPSAEKRFMPKNSAWGICGNSR